MPRLRDIVVDCANAAALARFWAAALEGYAVRAYDDAEIARLAALGLTPDTDPTVMVDGPGPSLCFQQTDRGRPAPGRWHLDLMGGPRAEEVSRLLTLGARVRDDHEEWTVMLDPEGNPFCVLEPRP